MFMKIKSFILFFCINLFYVNTKQPIDTNSIKNNSNSLVVKNKNQVLIVENKNKKKKKKNNKFKNLCNKFKNSFLKNKNIIFNRNKNQVLIIPFLLILTLLVTLLFNFRYVYRNRNRKNLYNIFNYENNNSLYLDGYEFPNNIININKPYNIKNINEKSSINNKLLLKTSLVFLSLLGVQFLIAHYFINLYVVIFNTFNLAILMALYMMY
ncbi:hypothetical protein AB836_00555 [Rickettsiales bacterium (ex Bugula neritina AB1)]|nr:hypothetical protein AB836_00555 [Rickettsiales bacterium (ex Bugula neritina AB1)]